MESVVSEVYKVGMRLTLLRSQWPSAQTSWDCLSCDDQLVQYSEHLHLLSPTEERKRERERKGESGVTSYSLVHTKSTHQVVCLKHQLFLKLPILVLPKHTSANNLCRVLMELLERNSGNRASDPTGYLTACKTNKVRHREELCLRFLIAKSDLGGEGCEGEGKEEKQERDWKRKEERRERVDREGRRKERGWQYKEGRKEAFFLRLS